MPQQYRLICILDALTDSDNTISTLDASPNYLHIHLLRSDLLSETIEEFASKISNQNLNIDDALYQWGIISEKTTKTRFAKVMAQKIKEYGQIGIGSVARGKENIGQFIGGGEAFLFNGDNYRITKGNTVFKADENQKYWTFQVANFNNASISTDLIGKTINGREHLLEILKEKSGGKALVATFDAEFDGEFFARSNGIFPEDKQSVINIDQTLFENDINGGHLLGDSTNIGDLESLEANINQQNNKTIGFSLKILSPVLLKPIDRLEIAKQDGSGFRKPRTEIQIESATKVIQQAWRNFINK